MGNIQPISLPSPDFATEPTVVLFEMDSGRIVD
jgi:hypothetical protein